MPIAELETDRLRLRPFRRDDVVVLHRHWADADVRKYLWDDIQIPLEQAEATVEAVIASAEREGVGMWCLFLKKTGDFVGFCGFRYVEGTAEVELLYGLDRRFWGQRLATEASERALSHAFEHLGFPRILAGADIPNAASFRVMERLGMKAIPEGSIKIPPGSRYLEIGRDEFRRLGDHRTR